jgi:hypothetical protein
VIVVVFSLCIIIHIVPVCVESLQACEPRDGDAFHCWLAGQKLRAAIIDPPSSVSALLLSFSFIYIRSSIPVERPERPSP